MLKVEETTSCKEEVLFNSDTLTKVISYLPSVDLLNVALTCQRFGSHPDDELSLVEESACILVHEIATEEQLAALPHYEGESSLADYHYLQLLVRAPLVFDQLVDAKYVNEEDKICVGQKEAESMSSSGTPDKVFQYTGSETSIPKDVTIVNFDCSVTNIDDSLRLGAFEFCKCLRKVVLNDGLQTIGKSAFAYCSSLISITIPSTVTEFEDRTFKECTQLREVVLNDGLKKIGELAFKGCESLERISIPSTVTNIDSWAFYACSSLKEVVFNNGLEMIEMGAFSDCRSVQSINIPSSVNEISIYAFNYCKSLRVVALNEGLVKIGEKAFIGCKSLQSITIPSTVTDVGAYAFSSCDNLSEVILNEGLKMIEEGSFAGCKSLESITLPSTFSIGQSAFLDCTMLREVVCSGELLPKIEQSTFDGCSALERITFPSLSTRLDNIIQSGQVDIQEKVQQSINRGEIEWRRGDTMHIPRRREWGLGSNNEWDFAQQHFEQLDSLIRYYEMKEATTIFELALWKAKIDQVEDNTDSHNRDACRIEVPGPVKDAILQYLDL